MAERLRVSSTSVPELTFPSPAVQYRRDIFAEGITGDILGKVFPRRVYEQKIEGQTGIQKMGDYLEAMQGGGVWIFRHPTERDAFEVARLMCDSRVFRTLPVLFPMALHQYDKWFYRMLGKHFDVRAAPIVVPDTLRRQRYRHHHRGEGLIAFVGASIDVLRHGGLVLLPITPGRSDDFLETELTIGFFLSRVQKGLREKGFFDADYSSPEFMLGFMDIEPVGIGQTENGLNPFVPFDLITGNVYEKNEIFQFTDGFFSTAADSWAKNEMSGLVSSYHS